jgi:hypothetical protein
MWLLLAAQVCGLVRGVAAQVLMVVLLLHLMQGRVGQHLQRQGEQRQRQHQLQHLVLLAVNLLLQHQLQPRPPLLVLRPLERLLPSRLL